MHSGEAPSREVFPIFDPDLKETEFLSLLSQKAMETGRLDPLFPGMVTYNVTLHLLSHLWPAKLREWKSKPKIMGFAANESGGKIQLSSLRSWYDPSGQKAYLDKAFVMQGPELIALCRIHDEQDNSGNTWNAADAKSLEDAGAAEVDSITDRQNQVALCEIHSSSPGLKYERREDPESNFLSEGQSFHHYRVAGYAAVSSEQCQLVDSSAYRRFGPVFMMREITGLGAIAMGLLQRKGKRNATEAEEYCLEVGQAREKGRPGKEHLKQAMEIIKELCQTGDSIHALWFRMAAAGN